MGNNKTKIIAEPGKQELFIERELDAPRELVFKAYTDPELFKQWMGPKGFEMDLEKFDYKAGGSWRYVQTDPQGGKWAFHGVVHLVEAPTIIVDTFEFEGLPEKGHVILQTAKFTELPGGRTKVVAQAVFQSVADRDGMIQSGMEKGVVEGFERLDDVLKKHK